MQIRKLTLKPDEIRQVINFANDDDEEINDVLQDLLYEYFLDDMPYGVAKARTGDPIEWIRYQLAEWGDVGIQKIFGR